MPGGLCRHGEGQSLRLAPLCPNPTIGTPLGLGGGLLNIRAKDDGAQICVCGLLWKLHGVQEGVRDPLRDPCLFTFPRRGCLVGDLCLSTLTPLSLVGCLGDVC